MKDTKISAFKEAEHRESTISIDNIINKMSGIAFGTSTEVEAWLCLANEIKKLKEEIKNLKNE